METYPNMYQLLDSVKEPARYYDSLPEILRNDVVSPTDNIAAFSHVRDAVDKLSQERH